MASNYLHCNICKHTLDDHGTRGDICRGLREGGGRCDCRMTREAIMGIAILLLEKRVKQLEEATWPER